MSAVSLIYFTLLGGREVLGSEPFRVYRNHQKDIFDVAWGASSPSSNLVLSASSDCSVFVYNITANATTIGGPLYNDKPI